MVYLLTLLAVIGCMALLDWRHRLFLWARPGAALVVLAVGMAYSSVVAAELFNGIPGIGGLVKDASNYNNTPVVLVGIFAIGFSGLLIDSLLRSIERRAVPWRGKV